MHLKLSSDRQAEMKTDFHKGGTAIIEAGQWEVQPDGSVMVMLTRRGDREYNKPLVMVFALNQQGLEAVIYDRTAWGGGGVVFERQPEITGVVWHLQEIRYIDDNVLIPDDPSQYTLALEEDGAAMVQADCNQGKGDYILAGSSISFRNMAYTRGACSPGSLSSQYVRGLDTAATCAVYDGYLLIITEMKSVMKFLPVRRSTGSRQ
jgi:heat shock protein HslJ